MRAKTTARKCCQQNPKGFPIKFNKVKVMLEHKYIFPTATVMRLNILRMSKALDSIGVTTQLSNDPFSKGPFLWFLLTLPNNDIIYRHLQQDSKYLV